MIVLEHSREQRQVCDKGFPNRFLKWPRKTWTDKQTDKHFRIYISRDFLWTLRNFFFTYLVNIGKWCGLGSYMLMFNLGYPCLMFQSCMHYEVDRRMNIKFSLLCLILNNNLGYLDLNILWYQNENVKNWTLVIA